MLICKSSEKSPRKKNHHCSIEILAIAKGKNFSPVSSDQHTENQLTVEV